MEERYIGENIRLIHDVITFANDNKVKGLIMFIDFEKAFDSIDHEYMIKTLTHFNFGPDVLQWITLFYSNANSFVINKYARNVILCYNICARYELLNNHFVAGFNRGTIPAFFTYLVEPAMTFA